MEKTDTQHTNNCISIDHAAVESKLHFLFLKSLCCSYFEAVNHSLLRQE